MDDHSDEWLTPRQVAQLLPISSGSLANQRSEGRGIPFHKLGARVLYSRQDVDDFLGRCRRDTTKTLSPVEQELSKIEGEITRLRQIMLPFGSLSDCPEHLQDQFAIACFNRSILELRREEAASG